MGLYYKDDEVTHLRPVYRKTDEDYFIFYAGMLNFTMVITGQSYLSLQMMEDGQLVYIQLDGSGVRRQD